MSNFEIGKIVNTQGLHGEVRVVASTFDPSRFELLDEVIICLPKTTKTLEIERVRYNKQFVILKFVGLDTIESIEHLRNATIEIPEQLALPLDENEYYIRDLYGLNVVTDEGENLGKLKDIMFTGANDVYSILNENGKTLLIPAIKQCILNVDIANKTMTVKLLEGLRD